MVTKLWEQNSDSHFTNYSLKYCIVGVLFYIVVQKQFLNRRTFAPLDKSHRSVFSMLRLL